MARSTINDVAALAGVSMKTVSRVVNKEPNVRQSTQEKVEKAIAELGYQPDQSARSLAGNRSFLVGLLYSNPSPSYIIHAQTGTLSTCRKEGFGLLIHPCDYQAPDLCQEVMTMVRSSRLDGLILTPPLTDNAEFIRFLDEQKIRYTSIAPIEHGTDIPCVYCDDRQVSEEMTEYLIELGHQRIGFILGHPDHGATHERYAGYQAALEAHGIKEIKSLVKQGYFDYDSAKACAEKLFNLKNPPTAIFASNDYMASAVVVAAHERGLKIPQQISIAGFDDIPLAAQSWPTLTTIKQPVQDMAAKAAQLLIDQIRGRSAEQLEHSLECSLIKRASTASPAV